MMYVLLHSVGCPPRRNGTPRVESCRETPKAHRTIMIQDTSLEIYLKNVYPNLTTRQRPVLHYLRNISAALTNAEIAAAVQRPINEITPRTNGLVKQGLLIDAGRRTCRITGNTAHQWKAKHPVLPPAREEKKVELNPQSLGISKNLANQPWTPS